MIEAASSAIQPLTYLLIIVLVINHLFRSKLDAKTLYSMWLIIPLGLFVFYLPNPWLTTQLVNNTEIQQLMVTSHQVEAYALTMPHWQSIWAIGTVFLLIFGGVSIHQLKHKLRLEKANISISAFSLPQQLTIKQSAKIHSPILIGVMKQTLVLPHSFQHSFNPEQQQLILEHEICHFNRKDIYWNLLAFLGIALFWFHPLMWLAYFRFRRDQELSCDQHVLAPHSTASRINYSKALINVAENSSSLCFAQLSFKKYGDKSIMLERINFIKKNPTTTRVKHLLLSTIAIGLLSSVSVAANLAMGEKQSKVNVNDKTDVAPIVRVEPKYPIRAAKNKVEGAVILKFDIQPDGTTQNITVIKSIPNDIFNKVAITALAQWQYDAGSKITKDNLVQLDFRMDRNSTLDTSRLMETINITQK